MARVAGTLTANRGGLSTLHLALQTTGRCRTHWQYNTPTVDSPELDGIGQLSNAPVVSY